MFSNLRCEKWVYLLVALTYQSPLNQSPLFPTPNLPNPLFISISNSSTSSIPLHIHLIYIYIKVGGYVYKFYIFFRTQCLYFCIKIKPHRIVYFLRDFVYLCINFAIFCICLYCIWARDWV